MISESSVIEIEEVEKSRLPDVDLGSPGFGKIFTDHMFEMEYRDGQWQTPRIKPYGNIEVTPAFNVFHYGQSVFEGTKAYYVDDQTVHLFRPEKNIERMENSCERLVIPKIESGLFMEAVRQLVRLDHRWIPRKEGNALYIRPFVMAFEPLIAAKISSVYRFYIILSPVGSYYSRPVKLVTANHYVRAVKGGTGEAKTAGNYAASLLPARKAQEMGFDQVLWLDAFEHRYIEEVGTMNIFFKIDGVLITPPLSGTILPGVTRNSIIEIVRHWDIPIEVRKITIDEVMDAGQEGTLEEVFGAGTAAVISPVEEIQHNGVSVTIHQHERGPLGQRLYDEITGIQTGKREDPFGWISKIRI